MIRSIRIRGGEETSTVTGCIGVRPGEKDMFMRILIQQKNSGLYFKDIGDWTKNPTEAMDFLSSTSAIDFCVVNKISQVQLVLKFDEQQYDIVLPVLTKTRSGDEPRKPL